MIIGFSGGMGVGKSTAIEQLEVFSKKSLKLVKFAGPLYDMQEYIYRRISSVIKRDEDFKKDRKLLQWLGTNWGREIDKDLWVKIWKADVAAISAGYVTNVVCDDVRFDNEAEAIKALGGYVIKINRPDNIKHAQGGVGIANHASEAGISKNLIDFEISNDDTVSVYMARLLECYKAIAKLEENKKGESNGTSESKGFGKR